MAYLEPGVYSRTISNRPNAGNGGPSFIPCVIGSGATVMKTTEVISRSGEAFDLLPVEATAIVSIGYTANKNDFAAGVDFELDATNARKIKWLTGENAKSPVEGESYAVTFTYAVGDEQFLPRLVTLNSLDFYGKDLQEGGDINNIYVAAQIILESGAPEVYMIQVKPNESGLVTGQEYSKALAEHAQFIEDIWRIVPADSGADINAAIDGHVRSCSSYEERKERCAVYGKPGSDSITTAAEVISSVGGYAASKDNERVSVVYPASATRSFSDGTVRVVTEQFVAAAYVGMESSLDLFRSKTRATSGPFMQLLGVQLTRTEKNKLAEKGVMIFEQPAGAGTNIICRHQLSTNMASAETRENSVLSCKDYSAKYLRGILDTYIGKYNITADTITKITGSVNAGLTTLTQDGYILEGALTMLAQDELNPDTIVMEVRIKVPYPCNYIKLTIISE